MQLNTYLNYGGNCEQAFRFYEEHLGGKVTMLMRHGEQPNASSVAPEWKNAVLHARMTLGGTELFGADIPPDRFQPMRSAYLSLSVDSVEEALKALGQRAIAVEGYRGSEWVLVDYFDFVVHVFTPEAREFYALERLWGSAIRVDVSDEPARPAVGGRRPA